MSLRPFSTATCRQISDADVDSIADLLTKGFPRRSRQYWLGVLDRLGKHPTPADMPRYGYLLESAGAPVGLVLLISTMMQDRDPATIRCNFSSWYVEPHFRTYAPLLSKAVMKKNVTYLNLSPAAHTVPIIEAQGFSRFTNGQFVVSGIPSLRRDAQPARVVGCRVTPDASFEPFERDLLIAHSEYGCISIWCIVSERAYPFVFLPRIVKRAVPCVQLLYCRQIEDFIQFASQIGSFLTWRGKPFVLIDSKGPIPGLSGKYFDGVNPKYYRGPIAPRLGDLAYSELAFFPKFYSTAML